MSAEVKTGRKERETKATMPFHTYNSVLIAQLSAYELSHIVIFHSSPSSPVPLIQLFSKILRIELILDEVLEKVSVILV